MKTADQETTIRVTSKDFIPGWDCDRRIADLLRIPVTDEVPSYCDRPDLTRALLESRCETVVALPEREGVSVLLFSHLGGLCVAMGARESHALASALLCSLEESPKV
jgi:hypothetical protein